MLKFPILIICIFSAEIICSQVPVVLKEETIGGTEFELLSSLCLSPDGTILLAGYSKSDIGGDKTEDGLGNDDFWVVKLDSDYNIIAQKTIGGASYDQLNDAHATPDGGYILGGVSKSGTSIYKSEPNFGFDDIWIVKLDADLNIEWENSIGGSKTDYLFSIELTPEGGYLLGATTESPISVDKTEDDDLIPEIWLVKLNSAGEITSQKTIQTPGSDYLQCTASTQDGGYFLGAYTYSDVGLDITEATHGGSDIWVLRLDSELNILYQNTIGGSADDAAYSIKETSDGGCIIAGFSYSGICPDKSEPHMGITADNWIIKLSNTGIIEWENTLGGTGADVGLWGEETYDGNYIVLSFSQSNAGDEKSEDRIGDAFGDYWIFELDNTGTVIWDNTIGGSKDELPIDLIETGPGKYMIAGYSMSNISEDKSENCVGNYDYWIMNIGPCSIDAEIITENNSCGEENNASAFISINQPEMYTYEWNTIPPQYNDTAINLMPGPIEVTITSYYGCTETFTAIVNESSAPMITGLFDTYSCPGATIEIGNEIIITGGIAPYMYAWYENEIFISADSTITVSPDSNSTYTLIITDGNGCMVTDTVQGNVILPDFANAGNDTTICSGSSITLNATGGTEYSWNTSLYLDDSTSANPVCTPDSDITYFVSVIDAAGCVDVDSVSVFMYDDYEVTGGPDTTVCENESFQLFSSDGEAYEWIPGLYLDEPYIQAPECTPLENMIYRVFITDINGCIHSDSVFININPSPVIETNNDTTICEGYSVQLIATGGLNYIWTPTPSFPCNNCDTIIVTPAETTSYIVTGYDVNGCSYADTVTVTVTICDAVADLNMDPIVLFPNPAVNYLSISLPADQIYSISIFNLTGNQIFSAQLIKAEFKLDISQFPSGTYFIHFSNADGASTGQFIKL